MEQAVVLTMLGMGVVMLVLSLIMAMIVFMSVMIQKLGLAAEDKNAPVETAQRVQDPADDAVIAVITAAVTMYLDRKEALPADRTAKKPMSPPEPATWIMGKCPPCVFQCSNNKPQGLALLRRHL